MVANVSERRTARSSTCVTVQGEDDQDEHPACSRQQASNNQSRLLGGSVEVLAPPQPDTSNPCTPSQSSRGPAASTPCTASQGCSPRLMAHGRSSKSAANLCVSNEEGAPAGSTRGLMCFQEEPGSHHSLRPSQSVEILLPPQGSSPAESREVLVSVQGKPRTSMLRALMCFNKRACMAFCTCEDCTMCGEQAEEDAMINPANPKAKPKPKPKAFPPSCKAKAKAKGKAKAKMPLSKSKQDQVVWKGPQPSKELKAARVVNWNPIRHSGLLEGSVWQQVNEKLEKRGHDLLAPEVLNSAFMRSAREPKQNIPRVKQHKGPRILQAREALISDLLHCQLARHGLTDFERLCWIVGVHPKKSDTETEKVAEKVVAEHGDASSQSSGQSSASSSGSDSESDSDTGSSSGEESEPETKEKIVMEEEPLNILLTFLRLADRIEDKLKDTKELPLDAPLASPERLLQKLLIQVGSAALLRSRVQAMLKIQCFPREADHLEHTMRTGIQAASAVVNSTALPVLLEGVLLLGNYVNSSSNTLGSALGVTLGSLVKLEHTRAVSDKAPGAKMQKDSDKTANAFSLLVRQLECTQEPTWLQRLVSDLEGCRVSRDLECAAAQVSVQTLDAQVSTIEETFHKFDPSEVDDDPASYPARLHRFIIYAKPRLAMLKSLDEDLQSHTSAMQKYFAEPPTTLLSTMLHNLASLLDVVLIAIR